MTKANSKVDAYFIEGCGRCELYQTPQCKVHAWVEPMHLLRSLLLVSELSEEFKWSQPCYTLNGKNVVMLSALKEYCTLSFFKGSLMKDPHNLLITPGQHSQADRQLRYTTVQQVTEQSDFIKAYIQDAITLEKTGAKVEFKEKDELTYPTELLRKMEEDPLFKEAFDRLTPGRRRSWNLHFTAAKQASTRISRIEKASDQIFEGKGWNER